MKYIIKTENKLETYYVNHPLVLKSVFEPGSYDYKTDRDAPGRLRMVYKDGGERQISNVITSPGYGFPYGVPISDDGNVYYVPGWQNGLRAYRVDGNLLLWKSKIKHCRDILVYQDTLLTISGDNTLVKLSSKTGCVFDTMQTSPNKDRLYDCSPDYCLVFLPDHNWGIVNKNTFQIVQRWADDSLANRPITDIFAEEGFLTILEARVASGGVHMAYRVYRYRLPLDKEVASNLNFPDISERKRILADLFSV